MTHGIARREPGRNVPAKDGVNDAVRQCEQVQSRLMHRFSPGRIHLEHMQQLIGAEGENKNCHESHDYRAYASSQARRWRACWCRWICHLASYAALDDSKSS